MCPASSAAGTPSQAESGSRSLGLRAGGGHGRSSHVTAENPQVAVRPAPSEHRTDRRTKPDALPPPHTRSEASATEGVRNSARRREISFLPGLDVWRQLRGTTKKDASFYRKAEATAWGTPRLEPRTLLHPRGEADDGLFPEAEFPRQDPAALVKGESLPCLTGRYRLLCGYFLFFIFWSF